MYIFIIVITLINITTTTSEIALEIYNSIIIQMSGISLIIAERSVVYLQN